MRQSNLSAGHGAVRLAKGSATGVQRHAEILRQKGVSALEPGLESGVQCRVPSSPAWIRMRLTVASTELLTLRQALHRALGSLARSYVVAVDYRHGETALHVEVARMNRDAAMSAIMAAFPAALFGPMTALGEDHVAH